MFSWWTWLWENLADFLGNAGNLDPTKTWVSPLAKSQPSPLLITWWKTVHSVNIHSLFFCILFDFIDTSIGPCAVLPFLSSFSKLWTLYGPFLHILFLKWLYNVKQKAYFFRDFKTHTMPFENFIYPPPYLSNYLKITPSSGGYINNNKWMTIKINSTRLCKRIKNCFSCSTQNPVLRKVVFLIWNFLEISQNHQNNLLIPEMIFICEAIPWRWTKKILNYVLNLNYFYYFYSYRYCEKPTSHNVLVNEKAKQALFRSLF